VHRARLPPAPGSAESGQRTVLTSAGRLP